MKYWQLRVLESREHIVTSGYPVTPRRIVHYLELYRLHHDLIQEYLDGVNQEDLDKEVEDI